jgi:hypothetical protein
MSTNDILSVEQAEALAAQVLAVAPDYGGPNRRRHFTADRERVESALRAIRRATEGLRHHRLYPESRDYRRWQEAHDDAWADLRRTARLYGVSE